jgi:hypothetical protein
MVRKAGCSKIPQTQKRGADMKTTGVTEALLNGIYNGIEAFLSDIPCFSPKKKADAAQLNAGLEPENKQTPVPAEKRELAEERELLDKVVLSVPLDKWEYTEPRAHDDPWFEYRIGKDAYTHLRLSSHSVFYKVYDSDHTPAIAQRYKDIKAHLVQAGKDRCEAARMRAFAELKALTVPGQVFDGGQPPPKKKVADKSRRKKNA